MANSADTKSCETCGRKFARPVRCSRRQWDRRRFCARTCKNKAPQARFTVSDRFWRKVERGAPDACWRWTGATDGRGYGQMSTKRNGSPVKANRVSWELHFGAIPAGMVVRHKCDNPICVNPSHLELGTQKDNVQDAAKRGRLNPVSILNLRPGAPGFHGAGPKRQTEV